ncbi:MAG: RDD family protein [Firmicutes bacterium]|nr:RDD family protein [Bacillota bacterium]
MDERRACGKTLLKPSPVCRWCKSLIANPEAGRLASSAQRLGACLLDSIAGCGVSLGLMLMGGVLGAPAGSDASIAMALLTVLVGSLAIQCYFWSQGTSLGKRLLGLTIYTVNGERAGFLTVLLRDTIGKTVSGFVFSLGFPWLLWDPCRECWHDKIPGTLLLAKQ